MAKRNVQNLLDRITAESKKDSTIRAQVDKKVHIYYVDLKNLWKELVDQLEGKYAKKGSSTLVLSESEIKDIKLSALNYLKAIKKSIISFSDSRFTKPEILFSGPTSIRVRVESISGNSSVFKSFISEIRREPLKALRSDIYKALKSSGKMNSELRSRIYGTGPNTGGLLDPGHDIGTSVTENRLGNYIEEIETLANSAKKRTTKTTNPIIDLLAVVKSNPRLQHLKTIDFSVVYVGEQGVDHNRNYQSVQEQILVRSIRKQIDIFYKSTDWGNFTSSSSANEMINHSILTTASKSGAKVKKPSKLKTGTTSAKSTIKGTIETSGTDDTGVSLKVGINKASQVKREEPSNWLSLLPIINSRLLPKVLANMKAPALVNRTGTFAQSAKVINIEQTREGYPSFVFDYERDPYDVFDRTKGRAPWNTPQRDPRALVDKSVREVVREMAINRFYTRRA